MKKKYVFLMVMLSIFSIMLLTSQSAIAWAPAYEANSYLTYTNADINNFFDPSQQVSSMTLKQNNNSVASNPGGIFYWVEIKTHAGDVLIDVQDVSPLGYFGPQSQNPMHLYVNGIQTYAGPEVAKTVHVDSDSTIVVSMHYRYSSNIVMPGIYTFSTMIQDEIFPITLDVQQKQ